MIKPQTSVICYRKPLATLIAMTVHEDNINNHLWRSHEITVVFYSIHSGIYSTIKINHTHFFYCV